MTTPFNIKAVRTLALAEIQVLAHEHPEITPMAFQPGEPIIREGEQLQDVFIVLQGQFAVEQAGAETPLAEVDCEVLSFAIVGEMAYLGGHGRTATVRAKTECSVLRLSPEHLDLVIDRFPMLTRVLCRQFATRLREANETLRGLLSA